VTNGDQVTAYRYDADGQLTGVQYPFGDDIVASALRERLSLGLAGTQEKEVRKSNRDNDGGFFSQLPRLDLPDSDGAKLHDELNVLLGRYGTHGALAIGSGATPFVSRLQVDSSTASALTRAYQMISPPNHARRGALASNERAWTEAYTYDSVGNRQTKANGWGSIPYTYNPANEMVSAGNRLNTYDPNGNLLQEALSGGQTTYQYTPNNRISGITMDDTREVVAPERTGIGGPSSDREGRQRSQGGLAREVTYGYDAFSRRVARSVLEGHDRGDNPQTPVTTLTQRYLYDGRGFNVLAELNTSGTDAGGHEFGGDGGDANSPAVVEYLRANGRLVERSAFQSGSDWQRASYYTEDILGSTMQLTGGRGQVRTTYAYDVFGTAYQGRLDSAQNPYGYTGKRYDPETMLYDYGMRDYNPVVGRWTTADPVGAGNNWYGYANEDPVNFIDRWGLTASDVANAANEIAYPFGVQEPIPDQTGASGSSGAVASGMSFLHQNDLPLSGIPGMAQNGCYGRALQAIAEAATGQTLSAAQIAIAVLFDEAIGAIGPDPGSKNPSTSDMWVSKPNIVVDTAFAILGHPEMFAVVGGNGGGAIPSANIVKEHTTTWDPTTNDYDTHFYDLFYNANGTDLFDPYINPDGTPPTQRDVITTIPVYIHTGPPVPVIDRLGWGGTFGGGTGPSHGIGPQSPPPANPTSANPYGGSGDPYGVPAGANGNEGDPYGVPSGASAQSGGSIASSGSSTSSSGGSTSSPDGYGTVSGDGGSTSGVW